MQIRRRIESLKRKRKRNQYFKNKEEGEKKSIVGVTYMARNPRERNTKGERRNRESTYFSFVCLFCSVALLAQGSTARVESQGVSVLAQTAVSVDTVQEKIPEV